MFFTSKQLQQVSCMFLGNKNLSAICLPNQNKNNKKVINSDFLPLFSQFFGLLQRYFLSIFLLWQKWMNLFTEKKQKTFSATCLHKNKTSHQLIVYKPTATCACFPEKSESYIPFCKISNKKLHSLLKSQTLLTVLWYPS